MIIVQHPREEFHPLNTARLVEQSLHKVVVVRASVQRLDDEIGRLTIPEDAALLFPSDDAEDLENLTEQERPSTLVIVDGTWSQAKNLLRDVPRLKALRRVKFRPASPSTYRIRKEPQDSYLSTIEAISHVLFCWEPETPHLSELTRAFNRMIDRNIAARRPSEEGTRYKRVFKQAPHQFPDVLFARDELLSFIYCEGTSRFARGDIPPASDEKRTKEPLVVYLRKPSDGRTIRLLLRTEREPPPRLLEQLALHRTDFLTESMSRENAGQLLRGYLEPSAVPVVWNASSRQILSEIGLKTPSPLVLKGIYCDYQIYRSRRLGVAPRKSWGGMEDILAEAEVPWVRPAQEGRGLTRLAQTEAIFGWLRELARTHCQPT